MSLAKKKPIGFNLKITTSSKYFCMSNGAPSAAKHILDGCKQAYNVHILEKCRLQDSNPGILRRLQGESKFLTQRAILKKQTDSCLNWRISLMACIERKRGYIVELI